ncbi:hypothetical protein PUNSTDRAFT_139723 [Punctularia strigosozonata HHB-11173 SS5]|uniref:Zn(2)-C6 fungal-type domain-containing protein n=1 Tax=Punctularia strigosozonata (strain HHB-11173) TaxID=741275 RepID=R7RYS8_PUNST|nr:uncharacterized protein PUNSTDRAFT_139723 [Punctularia strigosozonata HHB-11173 SS5]EIN03255.1 hypothetical protein PUNSTDRAFT_139723 [Punctularia strigosozonata HHB-11173 SS5]
MSKRTRSQARPVPIERGSSEERSSDDSEEDPVAALEAAQAKLNAAQAKADAATAKAEAKAAEAKAKEAEAKAVAAAKAKGVAGRGRQEAAASSKGRGGSRNTLEVVVPPLERKRQHAESPTSTQASKRAKSGEDPPEAFPTPCVTCLASGQVCLKQRSRAATACVGCATRRQPCSHTRGGSAADGVQATLAVVAEAMGEFGAAMREVRELVRAVRASGAFGLSTEAPAASGGPSAFGWGSASGPSAPPTTPSIQEGGSGATEEMEEVGREVTGMEEDEGHDDEVV